MSQTFAQAQASVSGREAALKCSPVIALLAIWVIGGLITFNLGVSWGWSHVVDRPLRTGTMQVRECHPDLGHLFVARTCTGTATFAPESQWRSDAKLYRSDGKRFALVSRTDVAGRSVDFTCYEVSRGQEQSNRMTLAAQEACYPNGQITKPYSGAKLWVPVGTGIATFLLGILAFGVLARMFFRKEPKPPVFD